MIWPSLLARCPDGRDCSDPVGVTHVGITCGCVTVTGMTVVVCASRIRVVRNCATRTAGAAVGLAALPAGPQGIAAAPVCDHTSNTSTAAAGKANHSVVHHGLPVISMRAAVASSGPTANPQNGSIRRPGPEPPSEALPNSPSFAMINLRHDETAGPRRLQNCRIRSAR
jgi:hypothetical protein